MHSNSEIPIDIVKGTDFYLPIIYMIDVPSEGLRYPVNITGYSVQMQVRPTVGSTGTPLVDISTALGTILIDGPNGKIELLIPKAVTSLLPVGTWEYDVMVTNVSGWTEQIISGVANVIERTTK